MKTETSTLQGSSLVPILFIVLSFFTTPALAQCEIGAIEATPTECYDQGYFNVIIDFDYANVGDDGFTVQGNGINYGTFNYNDLPVMITGLEGDGTTIYEFVVKDIQDPDCSNWTAIDPVDCEGGGGECSIANLVVDDHPCVEEVFYCYVNFDYENVSDEGFSLHINGVHYGDFSYADLPLMEVGPMAGDGTTIYHFLVRDLVYESCAEDLNFGPIDCGASGQCNIWDVYADVMPCDESGYFNVLVDFEYLNIGFDGFRIQGNGNNYGTFEYEDIPVLIGPLPGDGSTVYEFVVIDNEFEDCSDWTALDPVDCNGTGGDCIIGDLETTILPCNDDNEFYVLLDFEYANTSDGFSVVGNGNDYGDFLYANLPVEIGPLEGDGVTIYEFGVIDAVHDGCGSATSIDPVSCEGETAFLNFTTEVVSCDNESYELKLNFVAENTGNEGFMITGNDGSYGSYSYADLPVTIGPLTTDGITAYHFIARDKEYLRYGNYDKLIPFTCESLGLEENEGKLDVVSIFPNPSYGEITFRNLQEEVVNVMLYSNSGNLVSSFKLDDIYMITDLESGLYLYRIFDGKKSLGGGKIIVAE